MAATQTGFPRHFAGTSVPVAAQRNAAMARLSAGDAMVRLDNGLELTLSTYAEPRLIEAEWRSFENGAIGTVFQSFDWCNSWVRASKNLKCEDPLIVVARDTDGATAFIWPMALYCALGMCTLRWLGQERVAYNMGLYRADVIKRLDARSIERLLGEVASTYAGIIGAKFRSQPRVWNGFDNPFSALATTCSGTTAYTSRLEPDFERLTGRLLSSRQRKLIRSKTRKLQDYGAVEHQIARTESERLAVLETFIGQKAIQLGERGVRNIYADSTQQKLFATLASSRTCATPAEFHALVVGGQTLATLIAQKCGSTFHVHAISMTSGELAKYSPGLLLMHRVVALQCASGFSMIDFGPGGGRHKDLWQSEPVALFEIHRPLRVVGHPLALLSNAKSRGTGLIKRHPRLARIARSINEAVRALQRPLRPTCKS